MSLSCVYDSEAADQSGGQVPVAVCVCVMAPVVESQLSTVQAFPSSMARGGVPALHVPAPSQVSEPLQTFESEQALPAAVKTQLVLVPLHAEPHAVP